MMYTPSMNNIRKEYVEDNETNNHQATYVFNKENFLLLRNA